MRRSKSFFRILLGIFVLFLAIAAGAWAAVAYVGDIDYDGAVTMLDLGRIAAAFGSSQSGGGAGWDPQADLNQDDKIDLKDLAIAGRSYNQPRSFHQARRLANQSEPVFRLDACLDGQDQMHVAWSDAEYEDVYYTRLDRYGNTLIDDVLVDHGASTGVDVVAVGCDAAGNAHLIWDCVSALCEARFDAWGYPVVAKTVVDERWVGVYADAALSMDSLGRAHALYRMGYPNRMVYALFTPQGEKAVSLEEPLIADVVSSRYRQIAVDALDNIHLLWSEEDGEDRLYYARLGADASTSLPAQVIGYLHWDGAVNDSHRPSLATDSQGNALVLWNRANPAELYLEKIGDDGSRVLDDTPIFPDYQAAYHQDLAVDLQDRLHLWAPTGWGSSLYLHAYGVFDGAGQALEPMRWAMYGMKSYQPQLLIDSLGDAQLVFRPAYVSMNNPPCADGELCYQGTAFDPAAYDRSRPDLGVDVAHLDWSPAVARWGDSLTITTTVFNAGWTASPASSARIEIALADDTVLPAPAQAEISLLAMGPRSSRAFTTTLALPALPPGGYEALEYARLRIRVDPHEALAESTEANNRLDAPLMIQPLPTTAGVFAMAQDLTPTARGGEATPLQSGTLALSWDGEARSLPVEAYITVIDDLPLGVTPATYWLSWEAPGYRTPQPISITIGRNPLDPYVIDYTPSNSARFSTDTWGALSGALSAGDSGDPLAGAPLAGATVRILGQGLALQTTTDANGEFGPAGEPKLGQLIPGSYQIYASAANYARLAAQVTVSALGETDWTQVMQPTTKAYVRGSVFNQYGRPVSNATITACSQNTDSASDGSFDLGEVEASCAAMQVSKAGYADWSAALFLTPGLEEYYSGIELAFDPPVYIVQDEAGLASWEQDESSADLLPDPPEDASWLEEKIFDKFSDKFWPSYRVQVWWATYEYYLDGAYTGPESDRHLYQVQLRLVPKSFEAHKVSGKGEVKLFGKTLKVEISRFEDSGVTTALWVLEARLVDADSGELIKTVRDTVEGGSWIALEDATRTYDFEGVQVEDWANAEVWLYLKVGKNEGDQWVSSPILRGWYFDQQVLRFKLSDPGETSSDYVMVNFPAP